MIQCWNCEYAEETDTPFLFCTRVWTACCQTNGCIYGKAKLQIVAATADADEKPEEAK